MKVYTIISGVNGVGKSSFTGVLKERSTDLGFIVDVDNIIYPVCKVKYRFEKSGIPLAGTGGAERSIRI